MDNDGKNDFHRMPAMEMSDIHRTYGLWIFRGASCIRQMCRADDFYLCRPRYFQFYSISHMYDGKGALWLEPDSTYPVNQGDCVIVTPGTLNRYGGVDGQCYVEDTVNFCGPVADMLKDSGILRDGVYPFDKVRQLRRIIELIVDPSRDSQIKANIALQELIVNCYLNKRSESRNDYPLIDVLIAEIRKYPEKWWSVDEMAEMCNLSVDQLRRVFFMRTGYNPKLYVDRIKMNCAAEYMINTRCSIGKTAKRFGYRDQYHFSRRFKAVMGMSPQEYQKSILHGKLIVNQ